MVPHCWERSGWCGDVISFLVDGYICKRGRWVIEPDGLFCLGCVCFLVVQVQQAIFAQVEHLIDDVFCVLQAQEARLVLAWGEVNTALKHTVEEGIEFFKVTCLDVVVCADDLWIEEQAKHGADAVLRQRQAMFINDRLHALGQLFADLLQSEVGVVVQLSQCGQTCCYCDGVARERARLIDGAIWRHLTHVFFLAAIRGEGEAAADNLAKAIQVRDHIIDLRRATLGDAETCHDLVEHQQDAVLVANLAKLRQESIHGRDAARVATDGFEDDRCDVVVLFDERCHRVDVIKLRQQRILGRALGDTGRVWFTEGQSA